MKDCWVALSDVGGGVQDSQMRCGAKAMSCGVAWKDLKWLSIAWGGVSINVVWSWMKFSVDMQSVHFCYINDVLFDIFMQQKLAFLVLSTEASIHKTRSFHAIVHSDALHSPLALSQQDQFSTTSLRRTADEHSTYSMVWIRMNNHMRQSEWTTTCILCTSAFTPRQGRTMEMMN